MLKAVLVGCGQMSRGWMKAIETLDDLHIVGLVDLDVSAAERLGEEFSLANVLYGTNAADVISATGADVVFDIVVPSARRALVETALGLGCHVLSEKPLAESMADAQALLRAAEAADRLHVVVQNRRYIDGVRRLRAFLGSGAIGKVNSLHCEFFLGPHFGGFRDEMEHPLLLDMAIHTFDAARFMADSVPEAVYCVERNPAGSWYAHAPSANAIFEFAGGAVFTYAGSWAAEGLRTSWEAQWRIVGEVGSVTWDGAEAYLAERVVSTTEFFSEVEVIEVPPAADLTETEGHLSVLRSFVAAIQSGVPPETVATDNIRSLAMVLAAIESAETGRRVAISI